MAHTIDINTAHDPGFTPLAFAGDGKFALTGGSDSIVRIWRMDQGPDQEPDMTMDDNQEGITALAMASDFWLSGDECGDVKQYSDRTSALKGYITRCPGVSIRCLALHPKSKSVLVASDEPTVKLIDLEDTSKVTLLQGHAAGVRMATWHPSASLIVTSGFDGKLIIWDVTEEEPVQKKVIEGVLPRVSNHDSLDSYHDCSALWHPSGRQFFVASRTHEIVSVAKDTWETSATFTDDTVTGDITALALSPNGIYLASASNSVIAVWSTQTRRLLLKHDIQPDTTLVRRLAFSPTKNMLVWTDSEGVFSRWQNPIPSSMPDPNKITPNNALAGNAFTKKPLSLFDDADDGEKAADGHQRDPWDEGPDIADDDWIVDDMGEDALQDVPDTQRVVGGELVKEMVSVIKAQPAFQPGATPMDRKRRYLAFNHIGVVEVTDQDTHHIVNVEFHDQSARKGYHFSDYSKCHLASLGERGALFACNPEGSHPARVTYKPYGYWVSRGEWNYELSNGTTVVGLAAGGTPPRKSPRASDERDEDVEGHGTVVIATSDNHLIFLTGSGIELIVLGLDGDFVSMVAGSEWVFVVHRDGATTIDGSQNLRCSLITFNDFCLLQNNRLPIRKGQTLQWIGVSEEGAPTIYDSAGMVHILPRFRIPLRATWVCAMDTTTLSRREGKDESYWPIGLSGSTFMCLILKGRQTYPGFPRPLAQELAIQMPFRGSDAKQSVLEEPVARETMNINILRDSLGNLLTTDTISKRELDLDKQLIQLIQHACKADLLPRALDLTKLLHHKPSIDMAIKVAGFYHLIGLQEKMESIKAEREDEDRLLAAKSKRRQWAKDASVLSAPAPLSSRGASNSHGTRAFQDFGPPPAIHRPGLTPAMPGMAGTRRNLEGSDGLLMHDTGGEQVIEPLEGKRKWAEDDALDNVTKRRALDPEQQFAKPAMPKQKVNPFSRKVAEDSSKSNPFSRSAEPSKPLQKSDSFFEKVDAAEATATKAKRSGTAKTRKTGALGARQTTLFDLAGAKDKGTISRKSKNPKPQSIDNESQETLYETQATLVDDGRITSKVAEMDETTQPDEGEMAMEEDGAESETQVLPSIATTTLHSPLPQSPEPIEWPASPTGDSTAIATDGCN